jgi:hypothetical protein
MGRWRALGGFVAVLLACGLLAVVASVTRASSVAASVSQVGWTSFHAWDFDAPGDLGEWMLEDKSSDDGGDYRWGEETYTYTTGTSSVWPAGSAMTASSGVTYPQNLDTWMIYSFTVPVTNTWGTRLVFDWWLDCAPGDMLEVLTSSDGISYTTVATMSEQLGEWHSDQTVSVSPPGYSGDYYVAFRFESDGDEESGLGAFVDFVRLQYCDAHRFILPFVARDWPPPVLLNPIDNDDFDANYTLTWIYTHTNYPVLTYTLEQASNPDFNYSTVQYWGPSTEIALSGLDELGGYYYRVGGRGDWGRTPWSNVEVVYMPLHDDFENPSTDWTVRRTTSPELGLCPSWFESGTYVTEVNDKYDTAVFSPMYDSPPPPYSIRMRAKIRTFANETTFGMIWGSNRGGEPCPNDRYNGSDPDSCLFHYYRLNVVWGGFLKAQIKRIDYHEPQKSKGRGEELLDYVSLAGYTVHNDWNEWEIRVYSNHFDFLVNGYLIAEIYDTTYLDDPLYGIFSSNYEYNNASFYYDYFYVEPLPAGAGSHGALGELFPVLLEPADPPPHDP